MARTPSTRSDASFDPALIEIPDTEVFDVARDRYSEYLVASNERAVPDVRDGLKPVHRRILLVYRKNSMTSKGGYVKSAAIVGDALKLYHPHGDGAVYESSVKMAQPFALRYPLVDFQGNSGSIDGDSAAAYRYTEQRPSAIADEMLRDLETREAGIVEWGGNYTNTEDEAYVLPSRFPQMLANGILTGIGTGYSSMWLPHNLREVIDAILAVMDDPKLEGTALTKYIKGPDFPTGGIMMGTEGFRSALETGRGTVTLRARMAVEEVGRETAIIITEIPWQRDKDALKDQIIAATQKDKQGAQKIEGIIDVSDESGGDWRSEMRVVVRLKKGADPAVIANRLYKETALQMTVSYNQMAYVDGYPAMCTTKDAIDHYIAHQLDVLTKRTQWRRKKALDALEVQEAYLLADQHADALVPLARKSADRASLERDIPKVVKGVTTRQCAIIAGMPLYRFSKIDTKGVKERIVELRAEIAEYDRLLGSKSAMAELLREELREVRSKYGDERRTEINTSDDGAIKTIEELIPDEPCWLTVSHSGLIARLPASAFRATKRGTAGQKATQTDDDPIVQALSARTRDRLWILTSAGNLFATRVTELEQVARGARGTNVRRFLSLGIDEKPVCVLVPPTEGEGALVIATALGKVKRTAVAEYANLNAAGLRTLVLNDGDRIVSALIAADEGHLLFSTSDGYAVRCGIDRVSLQGRVAQGVASVALQGDAEVVSMVAIAETDPRELLAVFSNGKGKRTRLSEYPLKNRATKGVAAADLGPGAKGKGNRVAFADVVSGDEQVMLSCADGRVVVTDVGDIRRSGRATGGVIVVSMSAKSVGAVIGGAVTG